MDRVDNETMTQDVEARLWSEIGQVRFGMLGLSGRSAGGHFQPMTAFCEPETREIWFFTRQDSAVARETGESADALFVVQAKDLNFQASIRGTIRVRHDQAHIDRHWNPMVAAWFPGGKRDPLLTLLRLDVADAEIWITQGGPLKLAWEITKAFATHTTPDVGKHAHIDLTGTRAT